MIGRQLRAVSRDWSERADNALAELGAVRATTERAGALVAAGVLVVFVIALVALAVAVTALDRATERAE